MVIVMTRIQNRAFWQKVLGIKKHEIGSQTAMIWYEELGEEKLWSICPDLLLVDEGVTLPERALAYARHCEVRRVCSYDQ